ncbi:hypothetical protein FA13DRAFT_1711574 [Coprinellus micaceus]|uniref:Uncharacterized protein n=1 Tax=Coprinellus micaceus TaxID=71717 RepID=A0A4Y7T444_COPMI|nr:hypothetical protein FA13DRAFT_1711574 [Coprinellus micaceus]
MTTMNWGVAMGSTRQVRKKKAFREGAICLEDVGASLKGGSDLIELVPIKSQTVWTVTDKVTKAPACVYYLAQKSRTIAKGFSHQTFKTYVLEYTPFGNLVKSRPRVDCRNLEVSLSNHSTNSTLGSNQQLGNGTVVSPQTPLLAWDTEVQGAPPSQKGIQWESMPAPLLKPLKVVGLDSDLEDWEADAMVEDASVHLLRKGKRFRKKHSGDDEENIVVGANLLASRHDIIPRLEPSSIHKGSLSLRILFLLYIGRWRWRSRGRNTRKAAAAEQARLDKEAEEIVKATEAEERETARKGEEKKNRAEFVPVRRGVELPDELPLDITAAFTNEATLAGLKDLADVLDDGTFRLVDGGDGVLTWARGGAKHTFSTKVPDDELT